MNMPDNNNYPEISVIMPVFNVSRYVGEALKSLTKQTFLNWECIIIDDGSTDNSGEICNQWAYADSRIKVIHQKNTGQSGARNTALQYVKGKYIAFLDSDDTLEPFHLETLKNLIESNNADIAQTGFTKDFKGFSRKKNLTKKEKILNNDEIVLELLEDSLLPSFLWNKLFKKEVITCTFPEGCIYEDFTALTSWAMNVKKAVISPKITYHYRMRKSSSISSKNAKTLENFFDAIIFRADSIFKHHKEVVSENSINIFLIKNFIKIAKQVSREENNKEKRRDLIIKISDKLSFIEDPGENILGIKLWRRSKYLRENPDLFIKKMRRSHLLDFHEKYCRKHLYE